MEPSKGEQDEDQPRPADASDAQAARRGEAADRPGDRPSEGARWGEGWDRSGRWRAWNDACEGSGDWRSRGAGWEGRGAWRSGWDGGGYHGAGRWQRGDAGGGAGSRWQHGDAGGGSWSGRAGRAKSSPSNRCQWQAGADDSQDRAERQAIWERSMSKARGMLSKLPEGSLAAIVSFQGSFCPVTVGHVACLLHARGLLLGTGCRGEEWVPRGLEVFAEVLGFMGCNSDKNVGNKLAPLPALSLTEREGLIDLAAEEHSWLSVNRQPYEAAEALRKEFPRLSIKHFVLDGADAALWTKPWRRVTDEQRSIIIERAADSGKDNGTAAMRRAMAKDSASPFSTPMCIFWPEVSAASSTAARRALLQGDAEAADRLLHPAVCAWMRDKGPYHQATSERERPHG